MKNELLENNIQLALSAHRNLTRPAYFENEFWLPVELAIPEVLPVYLISNYGRVYTKLNNHIMNTQMINSGYLKITLQCKDNNRIDVLLHRLVMMAFCPIPNCELFQVNHKDTIKTHNFIWNLEWVNNSENTIHAYANDLRDQGEEHMWSIFTEDQVHSICKGLEQRFTYKYICENLLHMEYTDAMASTISAIKRGHNWKSVSKHYNIPATNRNDQKFTDNQIRFICKCFEKDSNLNGKDILIMLGYDLKSYSSKELQSLLEIIRRIRHRERFCRISKNYNF